LTINRSLFLVDFHQLVQLLVVDLYMDIFKAFNALLEAWIA